MILLVAGGFLYEKNIATSYPLGSIISVGDYFVVCTKSLTIMDQRE
jgi:hypothetical protein